MALHLLSVTPAPLLVMTPMPEVAASLHHQESVLRKVIDLKVRRWLMCIVLHREGLFLLSGA